MAERSYIIRNAAGEEVGRQTWDEALAPILKDGETADLVREAEEVALADLAQAQDAERTALIEAQHGAETAPEAADPAA